MICRPRAKVLHQIINVYLNGDLSDSETDLSFYSENSDDSEYKPTRKKRKRISRSRAKIIKGEKSFSEDSSSAYDSSVNVSNTYVLPVRKGNIASRIDLNNVSFETDEKGTMLYVPQDQYWLLQGGFYWDGITVEEFEEFARRSFSPSFLWLLRRCSMLIDQSMRDVYYQLTIVERVYLMPQKSKLSKRLSQKW